jgi:S-adenosylmethionine synthetase
LAYAIGVAEPVGVNVNTYNKSNVNSTDGEIAEKVKVLFDLRPAAIEDRLKLRNPIYLETAAYGHMGRTPVKVVKKYSSHYMDDVELEVELFTWEKLDYVNKIKEAFDI